MDLKQVIYVVKSRIWFISIFVLLGMSVSGAASMYLIKPVYEASATLILTRSDEEAASRLVDYNTLLANGMLLETYRDIVKMPGFMEKVLTAHPELNTTAKKLVSMVQVSSSNNQILSIVVRDATYERAAQIANAVSGFLVQEIPKIMKINNVSQLDNAVVQQDPSPVKPSLVVNVALGFIAGFLAAMTIVLLQEYLDDTMKSEQAVEEALGLPVLAIVPKLKKDELLPQLRFTAEEKVGDRAYVAVNQ